MAVSPPVCDFGWKAPDFKLAATDGRSYTLNDIKGPKGALVMFICNHCPYVLSALDRILRDARDLQAMGVGVAAICANDARAYPADSFDKMVELARKHDFPFPYLHDDTQSVARAWGAECTPDFFGLNADGELQYRGRLDSAARTPAPEGARRDLFEAMTQIAQTGSGPRDQVASMGCSIKWKSA
ncbi:thioredoxin family protein [Roseinatronobacter sp. S2]|uniref:thioredoxin family protein n=1 Tax=Roseinatronobacter sp. S2 TaxID=3035471 RepID=UPI00240FB13A|nr:thioredoxin family protein [Roseinatronobacter sp. S2]WFE73422.1 thioredoxin family protein [Roseinatronobacter sp. S2]